MKILWKMFSVVVLHNKFSASWLVLLRSAGDWDINIHVYEKAYLQYPVIQNCSEKINHVKNSKNQLLKELSDVRKPQTCTHSIFS